MLENLQDCEGGLRLVQYLHLARLENGLGAIGDLEFAKDGADVHLDGRLGNTQAVGDDLLVNLWREVQATVFFVTHSIEEALFLSDKVIVLSQRPGKVQNVYDVPLPRPRGIEVMAGKEVFDLTHRIKADIYGLHDAGRAAAE